MFLYVMNVQAHTYKRIFLIISVSCIFRDMYVGVCVCVGVF